MVDNIFSPENIRRATESYLNDALKGLDGNDNHVFFLKAEYHSDGTKIIRGYFASKLGDSWKLAGGGGFDWNGPTPSFEGDFAIMRTW